MILTHLYDKVPEKALKMPGKLDHIFIKDFSVIGQPLVLDSYTVQGETFSPSDHYPIKVSLKKENLTKTISKTDLIESYIGKHARTENFKFREEMRCMDLAIRDILSEIDKESGNTFFTKGWGQIFAAKYLLGKRTDISKKFRYEVRNEVNTALACNSLNINVRKQSKNILMSHPEKHYFPFKNAGISKSFINDLNNYLKDVTPYYSLHQGKLYLKMDKEQNSPNIFERFWKDNFRNELRARGFSNVAPNVESPHITLVNSNVIEQIKTGFIHKFGEEKGKCELDKFMENMIQFLNNENKTDFHKYQFNDFLSTYSEYYTPFEFCIVAKFNATYLEKNLKSLVSKVKEQIGIEPKVKTKSSFHMTVGVEYRNPSIYPFNINGLKEMFS